MPTEYVANEQMMQAVTDLISDTSYEEFEPIREQELVFLVAAVVKTNKDGDAQATSGEPVIVRRVGPADAVFITGHFKVYICHMRWDEANELQQKAMLHRALMRVVVDKTEDKIRLKLRKPDVVTFQQTIVRFGAWEDGLIKLRNNLQSAQKKLKEVASDVVEN